MQGSCEGPSGRCAVVLRSSLRATGSRERAPDDRLREAIHSRAKKEWIGSSLPPALVELRRTSRSSQRRRSDFSALWSRTDSNHWTLTFDQKKPAIFVA